MRPYMDNLFHKRGSIREEAYAALIKHFRTDIRLEFAQNNYITILSRCENSFQKGSAVEIKLASQAIGLLALTVGPGDCANEIYNESLRILPQALKSKSQPIAILESLAIVTFVRNTDFNETERSMQIIWEYINKKVLEQKDVASVVASAISAWSFLLAKVDHCRLDNKFWKGVIPFFLELLKNEYEVNVEYASYYPVVVEALALVSDKGSQHKFCSETDENAHTKVVKVAGMKNDESAVDAKYDMSELLKMNYLKHFLGDGFKKHVADNDFLHNVLNLKIEESTDPTLRVPEEKEVTAEVYIPGDRDIRNRERLLKNSRNSIMAKGKTQFMNKLRMIAQEKKTGQFFIHDEMD